MIDKEKRDRLIARNALMRRFRLRREAQSSPVKAVYPIPEHRAGTDSLRQVLRHTMAQTRNRAAPGQRRGWQWQR